MKIKSCYIENFGKFHKKSFQFDHLQVICEENGYGKTTLATFLKAMFYGLPDVRANSKEFNDREHFYPFSRGNFGGNIVFEYNNQEYKIERFFNQKSSKKDTVKVYKNNVVTDEFGTLIGKSIFGVDEDSFYRTIFITKEAMELGSTSSINEKLNKVVDNTNNKTSYEQAMKLLTDKKKRYNQKNSGLIDSKKSEIKEIKQELDNLYRIKDSLGNIYDRLKEVEEQKSKLEVQKKEMENRKHELERWKVYEDILDEKKLVEASLCELSKKYPKGIPYQEILEVEKLKKEIDIQKNSLDNLIFKEENLVLLSRYNDQFQEGIPSQEEMGKVQEVIELEIKIKEQYQTLTTWQPSQRDQILIDRFQSKEPTLEELTSIREQIGEYKRNKEQKEAIEQTSSQGNANVEKRSNFPSLLALGISIVFIIVGLLLSSIAIKVSIVLWVISFALMILALFLYFKNKFASISHQQGNLNPKIVEINVQLNILEKRATLFLMKYSYVSDNGILADFIDFEKDFKEYQGYQDKLVSNQQKQEDLKEKLQELQKTLVGFFERFKVFDASHQNAWIELNTKILSYKNLKDDYNDYKTNRDTIQKKLEESEAMLRDILLKFNLDLSRIDDVIDEVKNDKLDDERNREDLKSLEAKALKYQKEYNLIEKPNSDPIDKEMIQACESEIQILIKESTNLSKQIQDDENETEKISEKENTLIEFENLLLDYQASAKIIEETIASLECAEQNLKNKFIAPIKDRFSTYSEKIEKVLGEKIVMDEDCHILIEVNGENKKDEHLSSGQRNIVSLCLRLALIDNMYKETKPFIIMDDPFMELDENHLEKTLSVVKELSDDRQIIYFCCHQSRVIA